MPSYNTQITRPEASDEQMQEKLDEGRICDMQVRQREPPLEHATSEHVSNKPQVLVCRPDNQAECLSDSPSDKANPPRRRLNSWATSFRTKRRRIDQECDRASVRPRALTNLDITSFHCPLDHTASRCKTRCPPTMRPPLTAARGLLDFLDLLYGLLQSHPKEELIELLGKDCFDVVDWVEQSPMFRTYCSISTCRDDIAYLYLKGLFDGYEEYSRRLLPTVVEGLNADIRLIIAYLEPMYRNAAGQHGRSSVVSKEAQDPIFDYKFFKSRIASPLDRYSLHKTPTADLSCTKANSPDLDPEGAYPSTDPPSPSPKDVIRQRSSSTASAAEPPGHDEHNTIANDQEDSANSDRRDSKFAIFLSPWKKITCKIRSKLRSAAKRTNQARDDAETFVQSEPILCPLSGEPGPSNWMTPEGQARMRRRDDAVSRELGRFLNQLGDTFGNDTVNLVYEGHEQENLNACMVDIEKTFSNLLEEAERAFAQAEIKYRSFYGEEVVDNAIKEWVLPSNERNKELKRTLGDYVREEAFRLDSSYVSSPVPANFVVPSEC